MCSWWLLFSDQLSPAQPDSWGVSLVVWNSNLITNSQDVTTKHIYSSDVVRGAVMWPADWCTEQMCSSVSSYHWLTLCIQSVIWSPLCWLGTNLWETGQSHRHVAGKKLSDRCVSAFYRGAPAGSEPLRFHLQQQQQTRCSCIWNKSHIEKEEVSVDAAVTHEQRDARLSARKPNVSLTELLSGQISDQEHSVWTQNLKSQRFWIIELINSQ